LIVPTFPIFCPRFHFIIFARLLGVIIKLRIPQDNLDNKMNGYTNGHTRQPVILVHGGAWTIPNGIIKESSAGVKEAAIRGYKYVNSFITLL